MNSARADDRRVPFRVLIIGGGIGGLCLAQGLKKAGIDVAVYERDESARFRGQGYRIHINPVGHHALKHCLPNNLFQVYEATSGTPASGVHAQYDPEWNVLFSRPIHRGPGVSSVSFGAEVNRLTLREILLHGLDDVVYFDRPLESFEASENGRVRAYFYWGRSDEGDVLIGADGTHSTVRRQWLPEAGMLEVGFAIYGKTPMTPNTAAWMPDHVINGFSRVADASGVAMMFGAYRKREPFEDATARFAPSLHLTPTEDYLMWTVRASFEQLGMSEAQLRDENAATVHAAVTDLVRTWHPSLRRIVAEADSHATFLVRFWASDEVRPWPTSIITLLGDAIHTMPPFRGVGANTALRDAELLCDKLVAAGRSESPLLQALGEYEDAMLKYGFEAVRQSVEQPLFGGSGRLPAT